MRQEKKGWLKKAGTRIADITQKKVIDSLISKLPVDEATIRRYLTNSNLPVEIINYIIQQVKDSRKNITKTIKEEIKRYMSTIDISGEIQKVLSRMVIEIKTEIRLLPEERSRLKSNIKSTVSLRYDDKEEI